MKLTQKIVKSQLRELGITFRAMPDGDFRINQQGGSEATAYYASDLEDALGTGKAMARQSAGSGYMGRIPMALGANEVFSLEVA